MKKILLFVLMTNISLTIIGQNKYENPDIPLVDSFTAFRFLNVIGDPTKDSAIVSIGEDIGKVAPYPEKLSDKYDEKIRLSEKYYQIGDYYHAKSVLDEPLKHEPNNPFILDTYARAAYNFDKNESFRVYKILISNLDKEYNSSKTRPAISMWFREAYWKLGTLYMDNSKWDDAYYEISRFMGSIQEQIGSPIYIQALEYLTECAYMQYNDELAKYLGGRVLKYDPTNEYVNNILKKIK